MAGVIVVKYGGSAMENPAKVAEILQEIAGLAKEGVSRGVGARGRKRDQWGDGSEGIKGCLCPRVPGDG